jgi:formate/nitrite transporter FocA (FNT family)
MLSILAGFLIGMGGIIYLTLGGIAGALFFSLGLITIVTFKFHLFTGKAGLLTTGEITPVELFAIWCGNFVGTVFGAIAAGLLPQAETISNKAAEIVALRVANPPLINFALGAMCGLLMYIAVTGFARTNNYLFLIFPVAFFILAGFNHCVADMFYTTLGTSHIKEMTHLIPTTLGNIVGCNIIPLADLERRGA